MGKHYRNENPERPNSIVHLGARPLPGGNIEVMVVIRLFDNSYQLTKVMTLDEYCVTLEGLDLCARNAIHQIHQRELQAGPASAEPSSPKSGSVPAATAAPSNGSSTAATKVLGAQISPIAGMSGSANAGIKPIPIQPLHDG